MRMECLSLFQIQIQNPISPPPPPITNFSSSRFTEANKGRAYFAGGEELGTTLFVDYMKNRRSRR